MKLYKTTYAARNAEGKYTEAVMWHGSADAASKNRTALKAEDRSSGPSTTVIEVPTDKVGLLAWLNKEANVVTSPF